jgi:hypothetical protein
MLKEKTLSSKISLYIARGKLSLLSSGFLLALLFDPENECFSETSDEF